jgi:hypothetical protein
MSCQQSGHWAEVAVKAVIFPLSTFNSSIHMRIRSSLYFGYPKNHGLYGLHGLALVPDGDLPVIP